MIAAVGRAGEESLAPTVGVTHFERNVERTLGCPRIAGEEMETRQVERTPVLQQVVVAVRDIKDVGLEIFFDHKPRSAAETEAFALTDGVKPIPLVLSDLFAGFYFDHIARSLAQEATNEVIVVDFSEKADALRIFAAGRRQTVLDGDAAHLVFLQVAEGKHDFLDLARFELCQEVGLILHRIGRSAQPCVVSGEIGRFARAGIAEHLVVANGSRVVAGANAVIGVADALFERTELDEAIAHHVRIGRKAAAYVIHGVTYHPVPVLFLQIDDLKRQTIAACHGLAELNILFGCASEFVVPVHSYFNIEKIGTQATFHQQMCGNGAVDAAGK